MRTYQNPILRGFYPDPSICRVGTDYYLVTSSFEFFPGVPIFHSKDLVHWRQIGHCLSRESQLPLDRAETSKGIWAPTLRYHEGRFYMTTTNSSHGGNFYVWTTDPAGEWSDPIWVDQSGIDPDLFFDNGKAYFTADRNRLSEIDIETGKLLTASRQIWNGTNGGYMEAPHLYRVGECYYLMVAEGGTNRGHMATIARATTLEGPYESCPYNPILSNRGCSGNPVQSTGHADFVQAHDGSWWAVFLGIREIPGKFPRVHNLGRETFLAPVSWTSDGWPVVNGTGTITLEIEAALLPSHPWPAEPARDDFDAEKLGFSWVFLRNPVPQNYSLAARPGWLRLTGTAVTLQDVASPTLLLRRQTEHCFQAATRLSFAPLEDGDEAGLTVFMNGEHHYDLFVTRRNGERRVELRFQIGDIRVVEASHPVGEGEVTLGVTGDPLHYSFSYSVGGGEKTALGKGRVRYLCIEVAGGFTGVFLGLYSTATSEAPADFDWFEYTAP